MTAPVRLRLSRAKGFNLQAASRAINGLDCVNVARPSKWGNHNDARIYGVRLAIDMHRRDIERGAAGFPGIGKPVTREIIKQELRGKNLACWCAPDTPCHADILLEIANAPVF